MSSARDVVMAWLTTAIQADATMISEVGTHVYDTVAPQAVTPTKYVIISAPFRFRNVMRMGARIIETAGEPWVLKMVGRNVEFSELEPGANRLRELFHRGGASDFAPAPFPISTTGGTIHECYETDILGYPEDDAGIIYRHLGGLYFIAASTRRQIIATAGSFSITGNAVTLT